MKHRELAAGSPTWDNKEADPMWMSGTSGNLQEMENTQNIPKLFLIFQMSIWKSCVIKFFLEIHSLLPDRTCKNDL